MADAVKPSTQVNASPLPNLAALSLREVPSGTASVFDDGASSSDSSHKPVQPGENSQSTSSKRWQDKLTAVTHMLFYASTGDVAELKHFLLDGSDVNYSDYDGRSALHLAASEGQLEAVKLLIQHGAYINPKDRWFHTPLTDAMTGLKDGKPGKFKEIIELLLARGGVQGTSDTMDWEVDPSEIDLKRAKLIGKGAFGEIWKVTWRGTPVAVKMILPNLSGEAQIVKEFRDEVALLPKLRHPNIVQFLGSVTRSPPLMLITEYLPGGNLHEVIRANGALPAVKAVGYALDVARGMNYLHRHKPEAIVHRDLKPRNLLRDSGDHMKVADFGLSKLIKLNDMKDVYKMTGETGSYRYMAPEVFRHEAYDKSVDVFSFAVIFYEMFEGVPPFSKSMTAEQVAFKVSVDGIRPPMKSKNYPSGTKELIQQCWAATPSQRPSFHEVIERLEPIEKMLRERALVSSGAPKRG